MLRALRGCALLIVLLALIDPAITTRRAGRPIVALVVADSLAHQSLAGRSTQTLEKSFQVVRGPFSGAAAVVLVGNQLPSNANKLSAGRAFAVLPEPVAGVVLTDVRAAARSPLDARVPVNIVARVQAQAGNKVEFELRAGAVVVDRAERTLSDATETLRVPLSFVPSATGVVPLRVSARTGNTPAAHADLVVAVRDQRWAVLFFDRRPSWQSTFVRRSVEQDARFAVTSRTITSRSISTVAGRAPATLDAATLADFDAVVIGAPEALTAGDVSGLADYMRQHAGGVVLLFDQQKSGAYERLLQSGTWSSSFLASGSAVKSNSDAGTLRATQLIWPARLPAGARVVAEDSAARPVVWRSAVGAGRLVVSGALDAWKFRAATQSGFDTFWPTLLAETADAGAAAIEVSVSETQVAPGTPVTVHALLRDAALGGTAARASVSARLEGGEQPGILRLWPADGIGRFSGTLRAPASAGTYRIIVSSAGQQAEAPLLVSAAAARPRPDEPDLVRAWASANGGRALPAAELDELPGALREVLQAEGRPAAWHPMRSAWWILPFALLLSAEWWLRRRRGLA